MSDEKEIKSIALEIQGNWSTGKPFDPKTRYDCPICSKVRTGPGVKQSMLLQGPRYIKRQGYRALFKCSNCDKERLIGQYPTPLPYLEDIVRLRLEQYSSEQIADWLKRHHNWQLSEQAVHGMFKRSDRLKGIKTLRSRPIPD